MEGVAKLYDKVLEDEYLPLLKKAQPGQEMSALEDELKTKQGILRRGRIDFGSTPTGVDYSPLKGEYSYQNGESMSTLRLRSGTERHFFFFNDKLWKVYDEHKLSKGGNLGENFEEATKILSKRFGVSGKPCPADFAKGQSFDEAQWHDSEKLIRAVDRSNVLGMVFADRTVQDNLAQYRKNKPEDLHANGQRRGPQPPRTRRLMRVSPTTNPKRKTAPKKK